MVYEETDSPCHHSKRSNAQTEILLELDRQWWEIRGVFGNYFAVAEQQEGQVASVGAEGLPEAEEAAEEKAAGAVRWTRRSRSSIRKLA